MDMLQIVLIGSGVLGFLLLVTLFVLFFVSRRSQKVMESLLQLMLRPERAKIQDASRVLNVILNEEMNKIQDNFKVITDSLQSHIDEAKNLKQELTQQNTDLVSMAEETTKKMVQMSQRLDNTLGGLNGVVSSDSWKDVENATKNFGSEINSLMEHIETVSKSAEAKTGIIREQIDKWVETSEVLNENLRTTFSKNDEQMKNLSEQTEDLEQKLSGLTTNVSNGFAEVKKSASDYGEVMVKTDKSLKDYLNKLGTFGKVAGKEIKSQMNDLINTANVVGGQIRLSESSIDKQVSRLTDAVEFLMNTAGNIEKTMNNLWEQLSTLTSRFGENVKDFSAGMVSELKTVSGVANNTLENTKTAASAFSDSVKAMATSVRETLIEMNTAHTQLSGQSETLIKMTAETTAKLEPLSELIEKYYVALPDLANTSTTTSENLEKIVSNLNEKIGLMKSTVAESADTITDSANKLENLAGQSRQQMIDLMADYAKAVNTMQTLNKQMMVARATAPMDAIKVAPTDSFGKISSQDFLMQSEKLFEKMHEQALDLTKAASAEIPDIVWQRYHSGDKHIFSKQLAKTLTATDKKVIRNKLKSDAIFRSQASQFVRSFDKVLTSAKQVDNSDSLIANILQTDLGKIYVALKGHI